MDNLPLRRFASPQSAQSQGGHHDDRVNDKSNDQTGIDQTNDRSGRARSRTLFGLASVDPSDR